MRGPGRAVRSSSGQANTLDEPASRCYNKTWSRWPAPEDGAPATGSLGPTPARHANPQYQRLGGSIKGPARVATRKPVIDVMGAGGGASEEEVRLAEALG